MNEKQISAAVRENGKGKEENTIGAGACKAFDEVGGSSQIALAEETKNLSVISLQIQLLNRIMSERKINIGIVDAARFCEKIKITDYCWEYSGRKLNYDKVKHRAMTIKGKPKGVHRLSYLIFKGEIPDGLFVCHSCDNPPCVNPDHLWLGTALDNNLDKMKKGRSVVGRGDKSGARLHPERLARGERHPKNKLSDAQKEHLFSRISNGEKVSRIGTEYGICSSTAARIVQIMKNQRATAILKVKGVV